MENILVNNKDITDLVTSFEQYDEINTNENSIIGNAVSTQIKLTLKNKDNQLDDLLDYPFIIGNKTYIVYEKPEKWTKTVSVTLYDMMILSNVFYNTKLVYPTTVETQVDEMAEIIGIIIDKTTLSAELLSKEVNWYDNSIVIRNYLGFIAQCDGKNAFIENDRIVFRTVAAKTLTTDFCSDYELNELITFTRVCYDNGVTTPLYKGNETGKTLYTSANNSYIDQKDIDRIYEIYNGLSFYSFKKFRCREINGMELTHLIAYHDMIFLPLSIKRKINGGESKDSLEFAGDISIKNADSVIVKGDQNVQIRKIQTTINNNTQTLNIIAENQEDLDRRFGEFKIGIDEIVTQIEKSTENVYKFETGTGNIFDNCHQLISKDSSNTEKIQLSDMPLGINMDYMAGRDICISCDIFVKNGIIGSLEGYCGAEFDIGYADGTKETYAIRFYIGQLSFQYTLDQVHQDFDKRIYAHYKLPDKEIKSVSNLRIVINLNAEKVIVSNPKVEFGTYPTGFNFDISYVRDSIVTLNRDYTKIVQNIDSLSLQAVSLVEEITSIKGNIDTVETRLQSAELKLTPNEITAMVNEKIGADGELYTTKFSLDKKGVHISGGGLDISNNDGDKVLYADTNGNLVIKNLTAENGTFTGTVSSSTITGGSINGTNVITDSGVIGGWIVDSNGFTNGTAKIDKNGITNIYTWADLYIIRLIIDGIITADSDMISHYDFSGEGSISSLDYVKLKNRLKAL